MKCSNWIIKTHREITFQYQITFQMMKTMYVTYKIITNNEHMVCIHGKYIPQKKEVLKFHNQSKQGVHYNSSNLTIKLLFICLHRSTPCLNQINITSLVLPFLFWIVNINYTLSILLIPTYIHNIYIYYKYLAHMFFFF